MRIKDGFLLRQVAGKNVVLPGSGDLDLNMMITLNETGAFLWAQFQNETTEDAVVAALLNEYDVDEAAARRSVANFVKKLHDNGFLA